MTTTTVSRGNSLNRTSNNYIELFDNPVVKVTIGGLDNKLETPSYQSKEEGNDGDFTFEFNTGDNIKGKDFNGVKYKGRIVSKDANKQTITILDSKTRVKIKLDAQTCKSIDTNESINKYIDSYEEFLNNK